MPDINARAFRDAIGRDATLRARSGQPLLRRPLAVGRSSRPAARRCRPARTPTRPHSTAGAILPSTWTLDGRAVAALVHDEYHADAHPGRCTTTDGLACWYNTIIAVRSNDGGAQFRAGLAARRRGRAVPAGCRPDAPPRLLQSVEHVRRSRAASTSSHRRPAGRDRTPAHACCAIATRSTPPAGAALTGTAFAARWSNPYRRRRRAPIPASRSSRSAIPSAPSCGIGRAGFISRSGSSRNSTAPTPFGVFPDRRLLSRDVAQSHRLERSLDLPADRDRASALRPA